jgi:hypothetical protein
LLNAVEKEACNSSSNSGVMYKLVRLLSWERLLIEITEFLIEWPNQKLSEYDMNYDHRLPLYQCRNYHLVKGLPVSSLNFGFSIGAGTA